MLKITIYPRKKIKEYKKFLPELYEIYDVKTQTEVVKIVENLKNKINDFPEVIQYIINEKSAPYFKNLTYFLENAKNRKHKQYHRKNI
ncbi:hypothetical protein PXD04_00650 [Methanosphaera sp. ISO3-F5]|uniref:hypothetical protein n=1 Tax=Methanosphaera sp. ISO3-F5 TaxID=1452353 RepID=UPI002B263B81|nr:hypothetical protein [Methanosphaera sp. ISO3-F5]WQH64338.1 hypothetical protein PXD04_00650 [Methanosphaera sp. ISO3-F5]